MVKHKRKQNANVAKSKVANGRQVRSVTSVKETIGFFNGSLIYKGGKYEFVKVYCGSFMMGATVEQQAHLDEEKPVHRVTLTKNYYVGKTEVTQALWTAVMGSNPSMFKGNNRPVESVSWNDCQIFISKLNEATGMHFRLPTEAEWEFAARGGLSSRGYQYSGHDNLARVAWFQDNSGNATHNVATKQPNELGIYDMSGNVWEWCSDWYGLYGSSNQTNPNGPSKGAIRVVRGGGWFNNLIGGCRTAFRDSDCPGIRRSDLGLRLVVAEE